MLVILIYKLIPVIILGQVNFADRIHHVPVCQGPQGLLNFTAAVRAIFNIADGLDINLSFDCSDPVTGLPMTLQGSAAYPAVN